MSDMTSAEKAAYLAGRDDQRAIDAAEIETLRTNLEQANLTTKDAQDEAERLRAALAESEAENEGWRNCIVAVDAMMDGPRIRVSDHKATQHWRRLNNITPDQAARQGIKEDGQ